jgi:hypothetical protein
MATFEQQFYKSQADVRAQKVHAETRRALMLQTCAKIKPASMRPNLLNSIRHSDLRGGDVIPSHAKDDFFYYPSSVEFSRGATTQSFSPSEWSNSVERRMTDYERLSNQMALQQQSQFRLPAQPTITRF